ncbi:MAG: hypothetical protein WBI17_07000 [Clostridiaceae bacterium]
MSNINEILRINNLPDNLKTSRVDFRCVEIQISTNSTFLKNIQSYAEDIEKKLNKGQANSSEERSEKTVKIDNLAGLIAEMACKNVLEWRYGKNMIFGQLNDNSKNQIDIMLSNNKTIEVRSSFVKNGIDFALFAKDNKSARSQYFDVIGPYTNYYKHGEILKDYYMRVLYEGNKENFLKKLDESKISLFITGGATTAMMEDNNFYQIKHLIPAGGQVQFESDYRVIPLSMSFDAKEFFSVLESDNNLKVINRFTK